MKNKLSELMSRLNGINTPIGGVSWTPTEADVTVARQILEVLEDRRVLYAPYDLEDPRHCVSSVLEIRRFLTEQLTGGSIGKELSGPLHALRAACRKFLTDTDPRTANIDWDWPGWGRRGVGSLDQALGELRGVFGLHVAQLAARYGLDVPETLTVILPVPDVELEHPDYYYDPFPPSGR